MVITSDVPTDAEASAGFADVASDDKPQLPPRSEKQAAENLERAATERGT